MRLSTSLALALTIALVWAVPASAGTVCMNGGTATFLAADVGTGCPGGANNPGELNALTVSVNPAGDVVFTDSAPMTDGDGPGGCSASGNTGTCPGAFGFRFDLGDGDDSATIGAVANGGATSTGGDGKDHLVGGPLGDVLDGGPGNDTIDGAGGDDTLTGGDANDTLTGGDGADQIQGQDGVDSLDGGAGPDFLTGGTGDDTEHGGEGNDALDGGDRASCLDAGGGDSLNGDGGDDAICVGAGPTRGND